MNYHRLIALCCLAGLCLCGNRGFAGVSSSSQDESLQRAFGASVTAKSHGEILEVSRAIDELVLANLKANEQQPNSPASDEVFLRRIYLDIAGRIPTLDEARGFLDSKRKDKRAELIDSLLDSPGYVSHHFNFWADILRAKSRLRGGNPGQPYIDFIKESLASNTPYDQFVHELITASGPVLERGNGATGYYLRDFGMPEDNMANTIRVFLGTRLECAQCHDHPFDEWTQRDFYEMVAFTGGIRTRLQPGLESAAEVRRELRGDDVSPQLRQAVSRLLRPLSYGVEGSGSGLARLPDTYQNDDGQPNEIVTAKTMFQHASLVEVDVPAQQSLEKRRKRAGGRNSNRIPGAEEAGTREAYADWLTSPENPRFTQVVANRLWKKAMGIGLIEPVDDMTDQTDASNPELMSYLTQQMTAVDYDMKQFLRAIYNSQTYQRQATGGDPTQPSEYLFAGPALRRLTAEQLWDSFLVLAVPDLDDREGVVSGLGPVFLGAEDIYDAYDQLKDLSPEELVDKAREQVELAKDPQRRKQLRRSMMADAMMDSPNGDAQRIRRLREKTATLRTRLQQARKSRNPWMIQSLQREMRDLTRIAKHTPGRLPPDMARASELPSPARPGHFLREFGQSDREQIENGSFDPAVNQVLSLMNGTIEKRIIGNPRTVLMRNVAEENTTARKIDVVFLSMLSRLPNRDEKTTWLREAHRYGPGAASDLIWTLANTNEFMFVQ